jgi:hypothetical protein
MKGNGIIMARLFNVVVFDDTISGDGGAAPAIYYSRREHQALVGSADSLQVQILVDAIGTNPTSVTVTYEISNTGGDLEREWKTTAKSKTLTASGFTSAKLPEMDFLMIDPTSDLGAFGRFKITSSENAPCKVRVIVCGRAN